MSESLQGRLKSVLELDHNAMSQALAEIIPPNAEEIMAFTHDDLLTIVNTLQMLIDAQLANHRLFERFLKKLVKQRGILPPYLFVSGVQRIGRNPVIGGGFADVWKGQIGDKAVALKVLRIFDWSEDDGKAHQEFCKEAMIWRQLNSENVLQFYGVCTDEFSPQYAMVSPWMENGNMTTYLKRCPDADRLELIQGVTAGLYYLHTLEPQVIHGDLRGANVLIDSRGRARLADFGLARVIDSHATLASVSSFKGRGNIRWQAPELLYVSRFEGETGNVTAKSDVYALACVYLEIFTDEVPFSNLRTDGAILMEVAVHDRRPPRPPEPAMQRGLDEDVWNIMQSCWKPQPAERPSMTTVMHRVRGVGPRRPGPNVGDSEMREDPIVDPSDVPTVVPPSEHWQLHSRQCDFDDVNISNNMAMPSLPSGQSIGPPQNVQWWSAMSAADCANQQAIAHQQPPNQPQRSHSQGVQSTTPQSSPSALVLQRSMKLPPTYDQIITAQKFVRRVTEDYYSRRNLQPLAFKPVPDHERVEFHQGFEELWRVTGQLNAWMAYYHFIFDDANVSQRLVSMIMTVGHQRQLLSSETPSYILDLLSVRRLLTMAQNAWDNLLRVSHSFQTGKATTGATPQAGPPPPPEPPQQPPPNAPTFKHPQAPPVRPPTAQQTAQHQPQPAHLLPNQPTPQAVSYTAKSKPQQALPPTSNTAADPSPSPAASVSMPAPTTAATPTLAHASPQTPQSPKNKNPAKPKITPSKRRVSNAKAATAEPAPVAEPSLKRLREEDETAQLGVPSTLDMALLPKRIKGKWDGAPSGELVKKQSEVDSLQTSEQAIAFLDQMIEELANGTEGQSSLPSEISEAVDLIVKRMGTSYDIRPDPNGDAAFPAADSSSDSMVSELLSPKPAQPSGIANARPQSPGEPMSDPLRLGMWAELDGGESAYNSSDGWNWEGQMTTLDEPWAMST